MALALLLVAFAALVSAGPAAADYVFCPPNGGPCVVIVGTPGGPGGGTGGGASGGCSWEGHAVHCTDPVHGTYGGHGCYFKRMSPQPAPGDKYWRPHPPGGAFYIQECLPFDGRVGAKTYPWLPVPPTPPVSPATLAARAINLMGLTGPDIGIVPEPGSQGGLVGLPVWLWTRVAPTTWGPNSATAAVPGLSVTARANASKILWDMGDGHSVTCASPGMAYDELYGKQPSPRCGFTYSTPGTYTVTGTTYWHVTWAGGGQNGALDVQRSSSTQILIGELQVLVQ